MVFLAQVFRKYEICNLHSDAECDVRNCPLWKQSAQNEWWLLRKSGLGPFVRSAPNVTPSRARRLFSAPRQRNSAVSSCGFGQINARKLQDDGPEIEGRDHSLRRHTRRVSPQIARGLAAERHFPTHPQRSQQLNNANNSKPRLYREHWRKNLFFLSKRVVLAIPRSIWSPQCHADVAVQREQQ